MKINEQRNQRIIQVTVIHLKSKERDYCFYNISIVHRMHIKIKLLKYLLKTIQKHTFNTEKKQMKKVNKTNKNEYKNKILYKRV